MYERCERRADETSAVDYEAMKSGRVEVRKSRSRKISALIIFLTSALLIFRLGGFTE